MKKKIGQVTEFLTKFHIQANFKPTYIDQELFMKRCHHIHEELLELIATYNHPVVNAPLEEVLDALIDLEYLILGTAVMHGFGDIFDKAFELVHIANMAKIPTNTPNHKLGITKPVGWQKPNLKELIDGL